MSFPTGSATHAIQMQNRAKGHHTVEQQADEIFRRNHAYKYYGYPDFCRFMASDNDFFLLRRFGELNARVLLKMQFEIARLEKTLIALDAECREHPDPDERNYSFAWDEGSAKFGHTRLGILEKLQPLLKEYSECYFSC